VLLGALGALFIVAGSYLGGGSGATLIGTGRPLASALRKLDRFSRQVPMDIDPAHATAYIVNPLSGRRINFAGLFATHPPMAERIARLERFDQSLVR